MKAAKILSIIAIVGALVLPTAIYFKSARAQTAGAVAKVVDIEVNPDILLTDEPTANLKLNGVRIGDDVSAIPSNIIKFKRDDKLDCANCSYTIVNGRVWAMTFTDRTKLGEIQLPQTDPDLIQMRLGKADQVDTAEHDEKKAWKGYWFTAKRTAVHLEGDDFTGWVSITVCH